MGGNFKFQVQDSAFGVQIDFGDFIFKSCFQGKFGCTATEKQLKF